MTDYSGLPDHMQEGARQYVEKGQVPGHFLAGVLSNNFVDAALYADWINERSLIVWARWLTDEAPGECWGSPEKVEAWIKRRGLSTQGENDATSGLREAGG